MFSFAFCKPSASASSAVKHKVLPVAANKYIAADSINLDDDDSLPASSIRLKEAVKPTPKEQSIRANPKRLEEEIFLFTLDVYVTNASVLDFETQLLLHASCGSLLYQCDQSGAHVVTDLVSILRRTVLLQQSPPSVKSQKLISVSSDILKSFSELLRNYQEFPVCFEPTCPYNNNCFTSIRHALIMTDILLTSCHDFMQVSSRQQCLALIASIKDLIHAALGLFGYVNSEHTDAVALPFGQIIHKACVFLGTFSQLLSQPASNSNADNTNKAKVIADLVSLFQIVGNGLTLLKDGCGDETLHRYLSTLKYWEHCEHFIQLLSSNRMDASMKTMCKLWINKVLQSYLASLPAATEILFELKRLESLQLASVGYTDDHQLTMLLHDVLSTLAAADSPGKLLDTLAANETEASADVKQHHHLEVNGAFSVIDRRTQLLFTLHSRFLWIGMLRMMHMPYFQNIKMQDKLVPYPRINFPDREKWLSCLYELLTFVLKDGSSAAERCKLLPLAPFIAHMMLKIILSLHHDPSLDWIYWNLAKVMSRFNKWMRIATSSLQASEPERNNKAHNLSVYSTAHSVSSMSLRSHGSDPALTASALLAKNNANAAAAAQKSFDLTLETPFKDLKSPEVLTPYKADDTHPVAAFKIDDLVDGYFALPNGSKRWFPARITGINEDLTFSLLYHDGDIVARQNAVDIRYTKKSDRLSVEIAPVTIADRLALPHQFLTPVKEQSINSFDFMISPTSQRTADDMSKQLVSALSLHNIPCVESEGEDEDSDEEDRVYEIPSIFDGIHRTNNGSNKLDREDVVPRMHFGSLPLSSSLPHSASGSSLSCALVREVSTSPQFGHDGSSPSASMVLSSSMLHMYSGAKMMSARQSGTPFIQSHRSTHRSQNGLTGSELEDSGSYLESSLSTLGAVSLIKPHPTQQQQNHNLAIGNFSQAVREESNISTGNTRMLSWRGEESARAFTGRMSSRNSSHKPSVAPSDALMSSAFEVAGVSHTHKAISSKKTMTSSSRSEDATAVQTFESLLLFQENVYPYLIQTYALVAVMILRRCFIEQGKLDYACCINHGAPGQSDTAAEQAVNPLFHVREFLEQCNAPEIRYCFPSIVSTSANADGMMRLCKLLHGAFFDNCLKEHMNTNSEKVGEGGFGAVYRVVCPEGCGKYKSFSHCYGCYKKSKGRSLSPRHKPSIRQSMDLSAQLLDIGSSFAKMINSNESPHSDHFAAKRSFAVKCIPRERSLFDQSTVFSLYQEITALERLQHLIGVCGVEDYGVNGGEYWLVMEHGWCSLSEWRNTVCSFRSYNPSPKHNASTKSPGALSDGSSIAGEVLVKKDIALFLLVYLDVLLILRDVHAADVAHFDLKASNLILREDPSGCKQHIWHCQQQNKASGVLFLADFGEAIPHISCTSDESLRKRSRGTMSIQSPEMLCISESTQDEEALMMEAAAEGLSAHSDLSMHKRSIAWRSFKIGVKRDSTLSSFASPCTSNKTNKTVKTPVPAPSVKSADGAAAKRGRATSFPVPSSSSDVWSLGCLLVEIFTGSLLFQDRSWPELFTKLCLSHDKAAWSQDLECLAPALQSLDEGAKETICSIVLSAMEKEVKNRASLEQLIQQTRGLLESCFSNEISHREGGTGVPLSYSNSGDSDEYRRHSREIQLSALEQDGLLGIQQVEEHEDRHDESGQLLDIVKSLGIISTEVFSVFQFQPFVWIGCETAVISVLSPLLQRYSDEHGTEAMQRQLSLLSPRLTCQSLINSKPRTSTVQTNAHAFQPCLHVDEFISSGCGIHAMTTDFLSDMLWLRYYNDCKVDDSAQQQPGIIWIKVMEAKETTSLLEKFFQRSQRVKTGETSLSCLEVISLWIPRCEELTGAFRHSAALRSAVREIYDQVMEQWQDAASPPVILISVEDSPGLPTSDDTEQATPSSFRHIDKIAFSSGMAIAGMISASSAASYIEHEQQHKQLTASHSYFSWAVSKEQRQERYEDMEVLRLIGKLQRVMPWMDPLLDVCLVQELII